MPLSHSQGWEARTFTPSEPVPCFSGIRSKRSLEFDERATVEDNVLNGVATSAKRVCLRDSVSNEESQHFMQQDSLPGCLKDSVPPSSSFSNGSSDDGNRIPCVISPSMVDGYHNNYNNRYTDNSSSIFHYSGSIHPVEGNKTCNSDDNNNNDGSHVAMDDEMELMAPVEENCHNNNRTTVSNGIGNVINGSSSYTNPNGILGDVKHSENESNMNTMEVESNSSIQNYHSSPVTPSTPQPRTDVFCGFSSCRGLKPSPVSGRPFCHCYASWRGMYGLEGAYFNDYY